MVRPHHLSENLTMTTKYFCATCKTAFEDHDPVRFGSGPVSYPACPKGVDEAYKLFEDDNKSTEFWQGTVTFANPKMQAMSVASRKHKVDLQVTELVPVVVVPKPEAVKPKELSFAERLKLNMGDKPPPETKPLGLTWLTAVKTAAERAQDLLAWVDKCCNSSTFGTSAAYPNCRLHPKDTVKFETSQVISLASTAWALRPANLHHHAMKPEFKDDWRQRTEVDFIRDIAQGQPGRHIVHVIVGVKGEKGWIAQ